MFSISHVSRKCILGCGLVLSALIPLSDAGAKSSENILYDFTGKSDGAYPSGALIADGSGNFYGTATFGGADSCTTGLNGKGCGVIFKLTSTGTESALYAFTGGANGADPVGGLVVDSAGNFYGTTVAGGASETHCKSGCGTVFKLAPAGTQTVVYAFAGGTDGQGPTSGVIADSAGNLYGTTLQGGSSDNCGSDAIGCGAVFKIASGGKEKVLHAFSGGSDGAYPAGRLFEDSSGNLYGTTGAGGSSNSCGTKWEGCGTVFKIASNGKESVLHVFTGGSDGAYPAGALIADSGGNLYGTTAAGGSTNDCGEGPYGCGTVFKLAPNGTETILRAFTGGSDGAYPIAALYADSSGNLYGATGAGGSNSTCGKFGLLPKASGCGIVFEIASNGTETVLHVFDGKKNDGAYSVAGLTADSAGNLYGTTIGGGAKGCKSGVGKFGCGAVFEIKK